MGKPKSDFSVMNGGNGPFTFFSIQSVKPN